MPNYDFECKGCGEKSEFVVPRWMEAGEEVAFEQTDNYHKCGKCGGHAFRRVMHDRPHCRMASWSHW